MANDSQYKLKTLLVGTRGVSEYRASIERYIKPQDRVLEVGCEWGTTSELIYQRCQNLIATDISAKCIERARNMRPQIRFEVLDVWNVAAAMKFEMDFNKMYVDVSGLSGYRSELDLLSLLNMYSSIFGLEVVVAKSGALKNLGKRCVAWEGK